MSDRNCQNRLVDALFFCVFLSLCFNNVRAMGTWPLASVLASYASSPFVFPLLGILVCTAFCRIRRQIELVGIVPFAAYYILLLAVGSVSIVLNRGTVVAESSKLGFEFWQFKSFAINWFYYVMTGYLVFLWYRSRVRDFIEIAATAIGVASVPIFAVALLDLVGQCGVEWARNLAYSIACLANGMRPPPVDQIGALEILRVYPGRIRSLFPEPSFLGIWSAGALPILLWMQEKGLRWRILTFAMMTQMILSGSRLALLSLVVVLVAYGLVAVRRSFLRRELILLVIETVLAVGLAMLLKSRFETSFVSALRSSPKASSAVSSQSENVRKFVTGGSMATRLKCIEIDLRIFQDHKLFGCGYFSRGVIFGDYVRKDERKDYPEIDYELQLQERDGRINHPVFAVSTFSDVLAETGLFGFLLVVLPLVYVTVRLMRSVWTTVSSDEDEILLPWIAGVLSTFVSWNVLMFMWTPLVFGLALACLRKRDAVEGTR